MNIPLQDNTFAVRSPADMLAKLGWEFEQLAKAGGADLRIQSYLALNCAMTAWHMKDWVKKSLIEAEWSLLSDFYKESISRHNIDDFVLRNRAVALCQQVATAGKHMVFDQKYYNPEVTTEAIEYGLDQSGRTYKALMIRENDRASHGAFVVMETAYNFWAEFLMVIKHH